MSIEYTVQATAGKQSKEYQIVVEPQSGPDGAPPSTCFRVVVDGQEMQVEARRFDERGSVVSWLLLDAAGAQRIVSQSLPVRCFKEADINVVALITHRQKSSTVIGSISTAYLPSPSHIVQRDQLVIGPLGSWPMTTSPPPSPPQHSQTISRVSLIPLHRAGWRRRQCA